MENIDKLTLAKGIAERALSGMTRGNGHPFIEHADATAKIVKDEIGLGEDSLVAIYLHEATRANPDLIDEVRRNFNDEIVNIVEGLNKISRIKPKDTRLEAENYKRLIVSYSTDPRVIIIKIADRLEIMRSIEFFSKTARERKSLETLLLYIPLAHQLGLYNIKSEMENIYFKYADPENYRAINNKLKAGEAERARLILEFIEPLKKKLSEAGIKYKLKVRTKTAYSIWKKMQVQKVPFEDVYDVFAIRFIIDSPDNSAEEKALCWKVFSLVTEEYESDTKRLRDWLTTPKPNGYESLHITVKNAKGSYLEVQIRTARMDKIAESGLASHWSYKGIKKEATLDMWLTSVRQKLEQKDDSGNLGGTLNGETAENSMLANNDVFVFTPSGELRKLPAGASVLDFAFDIHSGLGLKCTGGLVNGKAVPIRESLKTGDIVEIIKGKNQKASADWLNYVVTSKARSKIKQMLKEKEYQRSNEGKEILASKCRKWKFEISDEDLAALMKKYRQRTLNSFYESIADGRIDPLDIKKFVEFRHETHQIAIQGNTAMDPNAKIDDSAKENTSGNAGNDILIIDAKNVKGIEYKLSKCCTPVYGDDIFGFVTRMDGIKIHKISCPNAARLLDQYPYRILKAKWSK